MRVGIGDDAHECSQIGQKRMLQHLFSPFVGWLVFCALPFHPFLMPGGPALGIQPFHVVLRIKVDGDGEVADLDHFSD